MLLISDNFQQRCLSSSLNVLLHPRDWPRCRERDHYKKGNWKKSRLSREPSWPRSRHSLVVASFHSRGFLPARAHRHHHHLHLSECKGRYAIYFESMSHSNFFPIGMTTICALWVFFFRLQHELVESSCQSNSNQIKICSTDPKQLYSWAGPK